MKVDSEVGQRLVGMPQPREEGEGGGIAPSMLLGRREKAVGLAGRRLLVTVTQWTGRGARLTGVCSREGYLFFFNLGILHKHYPKSLKKFLGHCF